MRSCRLEDAPAKSFFSLHLPLPPGSLSSSPREGRCSHLTPPASPACRGLVSLERLFPRAVQATVCHWLIKFLLVWLRQAGLFSHAPPGLLAFLS